MEDKIFTYSEEEIREVILEIHPRITAYIHGFSKGRLHPEDILQDVLYRFISNRPPLRTDKVPSYIYRAVRNKCLNLLTRNSVTRSSISIDEISANGFDILAMTDFEPQSPDEEERPDIDDILAFAKELPERTRHIFMLSRIEGKTHKEIAETLGISTRAVEKQLNKSVSHYRKHFGLD